jgi:hypothetical protein
VEALLKDPQSPGEQAEVSPQKREYQKPELCVYGSVGELTQSGGNRHHDGVFTRKLS